MEILHETIGESVDEEGLIDVIGSLLNYDKWEELIVEFGGDWDKLSCHGDLDDDFLFFYADKLNKQILGFAQQLPDKFIDMYFDEISPLSLVIHQENLGFEIIDKYANRLDMETISFKYNLPMWLIEKHIHLFNIEILVKTQDLSIDFINKYSSILDWEYVCRYQYITLEMAQENIYKVDVTELERNKKIDWLSEEVFIELSRRKIEIIKLSRDARK